MRCGAVRCGAVNFPCPFCRVEHAPCRVPCLACADGATGWGEKKKKVDLAASFFTPGAVWD